MSTPATLTVRRTRHLDPGDDWHRWDSVYVEMYWLPLLGPGSWALLRHLYVASAVYLEAACELDTEDVAEALGLSGARVMHSMARLYKKRLVVPYAHGFDLPALVRGLHERDIEQLAPRLRDQHRREHP